MRSAVVKDNHSGVDHYFDTASQHRQMKLPDIRAKSGKFVRLSNSECSGSLVECEF